MRIATVSSLILAALACRTPCRAQQVRPAVAADSVATTIAEAEAQGRAHKRSTKKATFPAHADTSAQIGRSDRVCVDVGSANIARSGDFYAGPFVLYTENWHQFENWSKLWWQPAHKPEPDRPFQLTVRIALLDGPTETYVYHSGTHTPSKKQLAASPETPFFGSSIHLPHPGRWLMVPSTGSNWGCVVFTLK